MPRDSQDFTTGLPDNINHPPHYMKYGIECIDIITLLRLPYDLGNVFKYLWRYRNKKKTVNEKIDELKKARFYLNHYIDLLEHKLSPEDRERELTPPASAPRDILEDRR